MVLELESMGTDTCPRKEELDTEGLILQKVSVLTSKEHWAGISTRSIGKLARQALISSAFADWPLRLGAPICLQMAHAILYS